MEIVIDTPDDLARVILTVRQGASALAFHRNHGQLHDLAAKGKDAEIHAVLHQLLHSDYEEIKRCERAMQVTPETTVVDVVQSACDLYDARNNHAFVKYVCQVSNACRDAIANKFPAFGERSTVSLMDMIHIAEEQARMQAEVASSDAPA